MGSWNETCALTRLPIMHGDPVVKFHTVSVPSTCHESIHEMGSVPLMLGLFSRGHYDDYGEVKLAQDALTINNELWCKDALADNNFWRAIPIDGAPDTPLLIPLEGQQLYYGLTRAFDLLGLPEEDYGTFSQWLSAACTEYAAANKTWADSLSLNDTQPLAAVQGALHSHGMHAFQERWMIVKSWMHGQGMLTAHAGHVLVHGDAFDTMVRSARSSGQEDKWLQDWADWQELDTEIKGLGLNQGWTRLGAMEWVPLSKPYRTNNAPISSHYWHTVEPSDALEAGHPGGQDKNRTLLTTVVQSVQPR